MPNKLSDTKMRKTLTEYKLVIALLEKIAGKKNMTLMDLMRTGIRNEIRRYASNELSRLQISEILKEFEPQIDPNLSSPTDIVKFKKQQRDFDNLIMELKLETADRIEAKNSIVSPATQIQVMEFSEHYA